MKLLIQVAYIKKVLKKIPLGTESHLPQREAPLILQDYTCMQEAGVAILYIIILFSTSIYSQENYSFLIKGKIQDANTKQPISNVNLICNEKGTITDRKGNYKKNKEC